MNSVPKNKICKQFSSILHILLHLVDTQIACNAIRTYQMLSFKGYGWATRNLKNKIVLIFHTFEWFLLGVNVLGSSLLNESSFQALSRSGCDSTYIQSS